MNFFSLSNFDFDAFFMVIFVDLVLSGDNAIIIGMAAAALPGALRQKAIVWGIGLAVVFRIILASLTFYLLQLTGIKLLGALLLLGVCYGMWRDLKNNKVDVPPENDQENFGKKNQEGLSNNLLTEKNHKYRKIQTYNNIIKKGLLETIFGGVGANPMPNSP